MSDRYNSDMPTQEAIKAHIEDDTIHPRNLGGGTLPTGTENQTLRKGASKWEATDILKTHTDGSEITVDHSDGDNPRLVNVVYATSIGSLVSASSVPEGTLGIIRPSIADPFEDDSVGATETHTPTITDAIIDDVLFLLGDGSGHFELNQEITYPDSDDWWLDGDFTIFVDVYITSAHHTFWASQFEDSSNYMAIHCYRERAEMIIKTGNTLRVYLDKSFSALSDGWHRFEFGVDKDTSGYIFIDGTALSLDTNTYAGVVGDIVDTLHIGWYNTAWTNTNIDNFKIIKGVCLHNANYTPSTDEDYANDENCVLSLKMNVFNGSGALYMSINDTWLRIA